MMYREIVVVCSEIYKTCKFTVWGERMGFEYERWWWLQQPMDFKELIIDSNFKLYNPLFPGPKTHTHTHFTKYFANQKYFCSSQGISFVSTDSLIQC